MNARQFAQEIKSRVERVRWPDGDVVFGSRQDRVKIVAGEPSAESDMPKAFPFALILIGDGSMDENDPNFCEQSFRVVFATHVRGDTMGEMAVAGGAGAVPGQSKGKGVYEILERVHTTLASMTGADGARILLSATSVGGARELAPNVHLVLAELGLSAFCTVQASYSSPTRLARGETWTWSGARCRTRHDFLQFRLVEKDGTEPSTDPSDGTVVYTGTADSSTAAATAGKTYTLFADYNSRGAPTVEASSEPTLGSYKTQ